MKLQLFIQVESKGATTGVVEIFPSDRDSFVGRREEDGGLVKIAVPDQTAILQVLEGIAEMQVCFRGSLKSVFNGEAGNELFEFVALDGVLHSIKLSNGGIPLGTSAMVKKFEKAKRIVAKRIMAKKPLLM